MPIVPGPTHVGQTRTSRAEWQASGAAASEAREPLRQRGLHVTTNMDHPPHAQPRRGGIASRILPAYLVLGALAAAASIVLPGIGSAVASLSIAILPVVAVIAGVWMFRPSDRRPWLLLAAGQCMVPIADVIWAITGGHALDPGIPSIADFVYVSGYPLIAAAFLLFIRARQPTYRLAAAIDALIISVAGGLIVRQLVIERFIHDESVPLLARALLMAYPIGDVVLLSAASYLMLSASHGRAAVTVLVASATALLAADVIYTAVPGSYALGWPQPFWLTSYLLIGLAALVPSMRELTVSRGLPGAVAGRRRIVVLGVVVSSLPAFGLYQFFFEDQLDLVAFGVAAVAMLFLFLLRMHDLAAVQERIERRYAALLEHASDAFAVIGLDGRQIYVSPASERLLGYDGSSAVGHSLLDAAHPEDRTLVRAAFERVATAPGATAEFELRVRRGDGTWCWLSARGTNRTDEPMINGMVWNYNDVTARHDADQRVRSQAGILDEVQHAVVATDMDGRLTYWNGAAERMYGWRADEVLGRLSVELDFDPHQEVIEEFMRRLPPSGRSTSEFARRHRNGTPLTILVTASRIRDATGTVTGTISTGVDITDRKRLESRLTEQAFTDELTGLANRTLFRDRLAQLIETVDDAPGSPLGILFVDLDDFKMVNDSLGHGAGDALLRVVGDRLRALIGPADTVARLGGDEFGIIIADTRATGVDEVAARVLTSIARPIQVPEGEVRTHASIGTVTGRPGEEMTSADLLRSADLAMYAAKEQGKSRHVAFNPTMHATAVRRLALKTDLERAVEHGDLTLAFQPIIRLKDRRVVGAEALARWTHAEHGSVSPAEFIPLAEESGLIVSIGQWVLDESCRVVKEWRQAAAGRGPGPTVSVNASARELHDHTYPDTVAATLGRHGLGGDALVIEVTEGALLGDSGVRTGVLGRLKSLGVQLAVDDFGTGYSSLGYLSRFPLDALKIDRQFVSAPDAAQRNWAIARSIVDLATTLRLRTVAEGIELPEQLEAMERLGVTHGQGFLLSRPVSSETVAAMLTTASPPVIVRATRRNRPKVGAATT